ncbi:hypothetical protein O181_049284 [Austropuccinia psidii MF-1]|uniref:Mitochondrial carrier protein n=1 Tax=Austropuccinia psidii MF-1 TaxID=1389203 RepID=A0A9Q3DUI5_9BASI|nr:hypothetical protein [Austropuccinia psidii MF-1]
MSSLAIQPEIVDGLKNQLIQPAFFDRSRNVRLKDKILAACLGGALTSLTMTPLDVVKTRLQTQSSPHSSIGIHPKTVAQAVDRRVPIGQFSHKPCLPRSLFPRFGSQAINSSTSSSSSFSPPFNRSSTINNHLIHNNSHLMFSSPAPVNSSVFGQATFTHPLRPPASGILDSLLQIIKHEGTRTLWRGIGPTLLISIPAQGIYMLGYDSLRSTFLNLAPPSNSQSHSLMIYRTSLAPLLAGALARSTVAVLFSPLELIRTRLQSTPTLLLQPFDSNQFNSRPTTYKVFLASLSSARSSGFSSLYAGLPATLWRDVPFSAIYWSTYEFTRKLISGGKGFGESDSHSGAHHLAMESFLAGSMSGCLAATITNPFDVVKTRKQAQLNEGKLKGTINMIVQIAQNEGFRNGLMKGLSPRLAKIAPSCGIMIASYEGLAHTLSKY